MSKIKKWIIAIAIVFNLFVNYGVATFHPGPEYSDYCKGREVYEPVPYKVVQGNMSCKAVEASQELRDGCADKKGYIGYKRDSNSCATEAYCETCNAEYEAVRKSYDGGVFVVLLIAAIIALAAGVIVKAESVSTGMLLAGILGLVIAATRYWSHMQNTFRFILLGIVLAILLWLGYKKAK